MNIINCCIITLVIAPLMQSATSGGASNQGQEIATLKKRAEAGDPKAQVELGISYVSGNGVALNESEAVKWFRKAAERGDAGGEYALGEMYLTGRGVSANPTAASTWIRLAAEHGDSRGQFNLAAMYVQGQGVPKDEAEGARWMRKAADQGLAAGQFGLGSMYAHGTGVPQSASEAARWYRKAADQADPVAMNNLAFLLATSTDPKVRDPKEAVVVAQRLVEEESDNAAYLDTLATTYFQAGQPDKAAETELQALTLKPDDAGYKEALEKYKAASHIAR
jgi:TPR repeat protein